MQCSEKLTLAVVSACLLAVVFYVGLYLYMVYRGYRSPAAQSPVPMPGWMEYIQPPSWMQTIKSPGVAGDDPGSTEDGVYAQIMYNKNLKKCFDMTGTKNGSKLQVFDCNKGAGQLFTYDSDTMLIKNKGSNRCIHLPKGDQKNGNQLDIYDCDQNDGNMKWERVGSQFQLADTTKCLDLDRGKTDNRNKIQIYDCVDNGATQSWRH